MKKLNRKTIIIILILLVSIGLAAVGFVAHIKQTNKSKLTSDCQDIIGDGYAMGTDPEPVVIGNTCEL